MLNYYKYIFQMLHYIILSSKTINCYLGNFFRHSASQTSSVKEFWATITIIFIYLFCSNSIVGLDEERNDNNRNFLTIVLVLVAAEIFLIYL